MAKVFGVLAYRAILFLQIRPSLIVGTAGNYNTVVVELSNTVDLSELRSSQGE
jgi:hypothetical protein